MPRALEVLQASVDACAARIGDGRVPGVFPLLAATLETTAPFYKAYGQPPKVQFTRLANSDTRRLTLPLLLASSLLRVRRPVKEVTTTHKRATALIQTTMAGFPRLTFRQSGTTLSLSTTRWTFASTTE